MSQIKSGIARSNITQKKRRTWNAREKLAIITYQEKTQASIRSTSGLFGIEAKQFRDWRLKKNKLMLVRPHIRRLNTGSRPKYPELEIELNNWIRALRAGLRVVTRNMIQVKAKTLARTQRFSLLYPDISTFLWSHKWLDGFMNRYRLSNRRRTTIAQRLPQDYDEKQQEFLSLVLFRRMKHEYPLKLIGNMDETPLSFDLPSNFTVDETGARTVSIRTCGYEKSNFTIVLGCMADGTKLPPLIIFKLKNVPRLDFPMGVKIRANQRGWMNTDEMLFWIENVWNHRAPLSVDPHSLLVLDSFRGHLVDSVKQRFKEKRTDLAVIPGGLTSRLQPLDIAINKPFKDKVRDQYNNWMAEEIKKLTPTGRIQKPAYNVIAQWIKKAWDNIDPALIRRSFKYCGISNNRDGSENRQIFDFNFLERHNSTSHVFVEENSSEGSSESVRTCEGSDQSVCEGVGEFNDVVLDFEDENYDEYYDMEVDNYINTWL